MNTQRGKYRFHQKLFRIFSPYFNTASIFFVIYNTLEKEYKIHFKRHSQTFLQHITCW
jgi:hypothetical protein